MGREISARRHLLCGNGRRLMPFDGTVSDKGRVIDEMLRILGPKGERWIKDKLADAQGGMCMLGALRSAHQNLGLPDNAGAGAAILEAIQQEAGSFLQIEAFNDLQDSFGPIRRVLHAAKVTTLS